MPKVRNRYEREFHDLLRRRGVLNVYKKAVLSRHSIPYEKWLLTCDPMRWIDYAFTWSNVQIYDGQLPEASTRAWNSMHGDWVNTVEHLKESAV